MITASKPVTARPIILAALSTNYVIGRDNTLPWHLPADLKRFKQLTTGQIVVMGRRTFESIGKPLPNRLNIVLSRQKNFSVGGVVTTHSINDVLNQFAHDDRQLFVIGGEALFREMMPLCQRMYLTEIQQDFAGDTFFPKYNPDDWLETDREIHRASADNELEYHFVVLDRKSVTDHA